MFGIRLPKSFVDSLPTDKSEKTELVRQKILDDSRVVTKVGITAGQKRAISTFVELFAKLAEAGKIDDYLTDGIIENAKILEEMTA